MKFNIKGLLDFFDDKKDSLKGDPNALIAMFGEELNAAVYKHFRRDKVEVLECSVVPGTNKGHRLDRWILDKENNKLLQCEIKNWAASAIGGKRLISDATDEQIKAVVSYYWKHQLRESFSNKKEQPNGITKVLLKMKYPAGYENISKIEPLLIYWMPISSDENTLEPFSTVSLSNFDLPMITTEFSELHIFSVSLHLRQLLKRQSYIDLDLPHLKRRLKTLANLQILDEALN